MYHLFKKIFRSMNPALSNLRPLREQSRNRRCLRDLEIPNVQSL